MASPRHVAFHEPPDSLRSEESPFGGARAEERPLDRATERASTPFRHRDKEPDLPLFQRRLREEPSRVVTRDVLEGEVPYLESTRDRRRQLRDAMVEQGHATLQGV